MPAAQEDADRARLEALRTAVNRELDKLEALLRQFREVVQSDNGSHTSVQRTDHF